jgi:hypothetical protein
VYPIVRRPTIYRVAPRTRDPANRGFTTRTGWDEVTMSFWRPAARHDHFVTLYTAGGDDRTREGLRSWSVWRGAGGTAGTGG